MNTRRNAPMSDIVKEAAEELGFKVIDISIDKSNTPGELIGFPTPRTGDTQ